MELRGYTNFLYHFISKMPPVYMLKINNSQNILKPQITYYARGSISENVPLKYIRDWTICKMTFPGGKLENKSLNWPFLKFQQKIRNYLATIRRARSIRAIFRRELGLISFV
jgi:hypothetical protein